MTSVARMMAIADAKAAEASAKKPKIDKPSKAKGTKKTAKKAARAEVQKIEAVGPLVRLIFPCSKALADRITACWHKESLGSKSETIRVLIERGLGGALLERGGK